MRRFLAIGVGAAVAFVGSLIPLGSVWAEYVNTITRDQPTLNLRDAPGTRGNILTQLQQNTFVRVIGSSGNWRQVSLSDGSNGWVHGRYLGDGTVDYFTPFVATHRLTNLPRGFMNLREGPGTNFAVVTRGYMNDDLMATGTERGRWLEVQLPDFSYVWVHASGLSPLPAQAVGGGQSVPPQAPGTAGEGAGTVTTAGYLPPPAIYCAINASDPLTQYDCRDRALNDVATRVARAAVTIEPSLSGYDRRRLEFSQQRFAEFQLRDCQIPSGAPTSEREFERIVGCLSEVKRLRLWQLDQRYLDNYVTPDNATAEDRAPDRRFADVNATATGIDVVAAQPVRFAVDRRLISVLAGFDVEITDRDNDGAFVDFHSAELGGEGRDQEISTFLEPGRYRVSYTLVYRGGAEDVRVDNLNIVAGEQPQACTLRRRSMRCVDQ